MLFASGGCILIVIDSTERVEEEIKLILTQHFPALLEKNGRKESVSTIFATTAPACSVPMACMKEIQAWLDHRDISTTMNIYTHLDVDSKIASANAILNIFPVE